MTTMITNLPSDLVQEIISRVPFKFVRAVRLTCKNWNALFKSRSFSKMLLDKEESAARELGESRLIVLMDYNLHLMGIVVNENPSTELLGKLTFLNESEQVKISLVFHCEGLLLCILKDDNTKVVVWNPYLGQTRWIQNRYFEGLDMYKYAIGYENKKNRSCHSHKMLRFIDGIYNNFSRYEIYNFDSDLWNTLTVTPQWHIESCHHGVSLKGNTYWFAREKKSLEVINHIVCFDFTRERFGPLLHLPFHVSCRQTISCVREDKLAVCNTFGKIEIWMTTNIEAEKISWSKFLTMETKIYYLVSYTSFLVDEGKKLVMGFDEYSNSIYHNTLDIIGETGYVTKLVLGERAYKNCRKADVQVWSFVPSLVQIKQQARVKRKVHPKQL